MAEAPDEDLARELERLRRSYQGKLAEMLARLASHVREAQKVPDGGELRAARELAHRLKGTSGSYGFDVCSVELGTIEDRLNLLADGVPSNAAAAWLEIEQALTRARGGC
jgi:hypothetical protein